GRSDLRVEDLAGRGADGVLASPQFERVRTLPDACVSCPFVSTCHGGCSGRRQLPGGRERGGCSWPRARGHAGWLRTAAPRSTAERRDVLKTGRACTTVLGPA